MKQDKLNTDSFGVRVFPVARQFFLQHATFATSHHANTRKHSFSLSRLARNAQTSIGLREGNSFRRRARAAAPPLRSQNSLTRADLFNRFLQLRFDSRGATMAGASTILHRAAAATVGPLPSGMRPTTALACICAMCTCGRHRCPAHPDAVPAFAACVSWGAKVTIARRGAAGNRARRRAFCAGRSGKSPLSSVYPPRLNDRGELNVFFSLRCGGGSLLCHISLPHSLLTHSRPRARGPISTLSPPLAPFQPSLMVTYHLIHFIADVAAPPPPARSSST
jgi:hypothetical protein